MTEAAIYKFGDVIELSGFDKVDAGSMQILKKLIGNQARKICDKTQGFEKIKLRLLDSEEKKWVVAGELLAKGETMKTEFEHMNLFVSVSKVLDEMGSKKIEK